MYRVVQEALTNAARYAGPARVTIRVRYEPGVVEVEIADDGRGKADGTSRVTGSGQGLVGMRERVQSCGGVVEAGPRAEGGFRVYARIPASPQTTPISPPASSPSPGKRIGPFRALLSRSSDHLFAAASLVALEAAVVSYSHGHGWLWLNATAMALVSAAALWRRRAPLLFLAVVGAAALASHGLTPTDRATLTGTYILLAPTYNLGAWASRQRALLGLGLWAVGAVMVSAAHQDISAGLFAGLAMGCLAWAAGRLIRGERDIAERLGVIADRLERERELRSELAIAKERGRLARQLQNQVAQLIVAMIVQAEAAAKTANLRTDESIGAILAIESTGKDALAQMRTILGVLRSGSLYAELQPQPGLAQLQSLIERARQRGQPVEVAILGEAGDLDASVDLAAYRIVEEIVGAPGAGPVSPISISIRYTTEALDLEVAATGNGRVWATERIRERVALCHGDLWSPIDDANPTRLVVRLPRAPQGALT